MREKMVSDKYTSLDTACHWQGEEQLKNMAKEFILPEVCPKPGCNGTKFTKHEDGYQCLNCFKIIYVKSKVVRKRNRQLVLI